jgi:hypothetical protein
LIETSEPGGIKRELIAFAELFAMCGFAIAQPLLSVLGQSPDLFIFRDANPSEIIVLAIVIVVAAPIALWVLEVLVGLVSKRARRVVHLVLLGALAAVFVMQAFKRATELRGVLLVVLAAGAAAGLVTLYTRFKATQTWLLVVSPAPIVFALIFVLSSPVSKIVFPADAHAAVLGSPRNAPSIVMITFDEWPLSSIVGSDGKIDATLYPNLAQLAAGSTWYRNTTSITNSTWHAIPHLLTGRLGKSNQVPEASYHPQNLFTFLGGTYRLRVSETVTRLCPRTLCETTPEPGAHGLRTLAKDVAKTYRDMISPNDSDAEVTAGFEERTTTAAVDQAKNATGENDKAVVDLGAATANRPQRFQGFLDGMNAAEPPTLHFLHLLLPHVTYRFLPSGREYPAPPDDFGRTDDEYNAETWPPQLAHQRLLLQTAYVDRLVGELLDSLRAKGMYDKTVLVLTADHGIAFAPNGPGRGLQDHPIDPKLYPDVLSVPLFVKASGQQRGATSDANVMTIDVVPTIAKLAGFDLPWKVDGVPAGERRDQRKIFRKATVNPFGVEMGPEIVYDGAQNEKEMLARNVDTVAKPGDALQLSRVGPHAELVGKSVADVPHGDRADVTINDPGAYQNVKAAPEPLPALLYGNASRAGDLLVVLNGKVAGVSPTFRDGGQAHRFAVMLPEPLFRTGANDLQLYWLQ